MSAAHLPTPRPPQQMVLAAVCHMEALARRKGQMTFAVLSADAAGWAHEACDTMDAIAEQAHTMGGRVDLYAADGVFSPDEREQLAADAADIERMARSGRRTAA